MNRDRKDKRGKTICRLQNLLACLQESLAKLINRDYKEFNKTMRPDLPVIQSNDESYIVKPYCHLIC